MLSIQAEKNRIIRERNKDFKDRQRIKKHLQIIVDKIGFMVAKDWDHFDAGETSHLGNIQAILMSMIESRDGGK